jgi:hypothetical protein
LGYTSVRDSTTPAIKPNNQHVDNNQDQDQDQHQDHQSYRRPSHSQSRTSESPDKSINPIGGTAGQSRSNSFTGVGAAGPSYNLGGPGASLSAYSLAQPSRHHHHTNQNHDPYLQSETPKSSNSNSNSTPGSGSDNNNTKPILPQPRRFPSIGTVFGYGESSALNDRLSTTRPIDRENLTTLPLPGDAPNPLGILAEATISLDPGSSSSGSGSLPSSAYNRGGKANKNETSNRPPPEGTDYYSSSKKSVTPRTLKSEAPHIMQLISPSDAESLFETYWKKIHPHLPVLDRKRSACIDVASRSNYLFNASESEGVLLNVARFGGWRLLS